MTDPVFGNNQDSKKVKWYNPVDVVADFAKQSVINVAAITGTGAAGSAIFGRAKFYFDAPFANNPNLSLTQKQISRVNKFADLRVILEEVGHDFSKIAGQTTKYMSSAGAAFSYAVEQGKVNQPGAVQVMHQARAGARNSYNAANAAGVSRLKAAGEWAKSFFIGTNPANNQYGIIDSIPAFRGFSAGLHAFGTRFKDSLVANDVISGAQSFNSAVNRINAPATSATDRLKDAILSIQSMHRSKFSSFGDSVIHIMGKGGPGGTASDPGMLEKTIRGNEYRGQLKRSLVNNGINADDADRFVRTIDVVATPRSSRNIAAVSTRIKIGKNRSIAETDDEFYETAVKIFRKANPEVTDMFTRDALKASVASTDSLFVSRSFKRGLDLQVKKQWDTFYSDTVLPYGQTVLKPQKAVYQDFVGPLTSAKEEFLTRRTAQVLGIKLLDDQGRKISNDIIAREVAKRGLNPNDFGELRAFLIKGKAMTSRASSGGYNLFGMKQLLVDEAFTHGVFNYMKPEQRDVIRDVAAKVKINDPVSSSIGFSKIDGIYKNKSGEIVDLTKIKSMTSSMLDFFTQQFRIPIVRFNPLQMLGFGGPGGVDKFAPIQIASGLSTQPFGRLESHAGDIYAWTKKSSGLFGPKGNLSILGKDPTTLQSSTTNLQGLYNIVNPQESNIFTRALSYMMNRKSVPTAQMDAAANGSDLKFIDRVKKLFDVDEEQPNSLFRLASRFRKRNTDINNPRVLMQLVTNADNDVSVGRGATLRLDTTGPQFRVVDQAGREVYDHKAVLRAYDRFQEQPFQYGTPLPFMREVEEKLAQRAAATGQVNPLRMDVPFLQRSFSPSEITNEAEATEFAEELIRRTRAELSVLRSRGIDTTGTTRQLSRIEKMLENTNLRQVSARADVSPSISTRLDELRNEIFRLMIQKQSVATQSNPSALLAEMDTIIRDMISSGRLSAAQAAEARAAGFATILNMNALAQFNPLNQAGTNTKEALRGLVDIARAAPDATKSMLNPYLSGTSAIINANGVRAFGSPFKPAIKRLFGTAPYSVDEYASNPFGNQNLVFVPTAATARQIAGNGAVNRSIVGLNTYSNPEAVSFASIPISHGFERLNRYFGTVGAGLSLDKYKGPLDLYARGMVGKRILPAFAGGATFLAADRTVGGMVNERDIRGEKVYSPFLIGQAASGIAQSQAIAAQIVPGGMNYQEKKDQITQGEVPIRQGRYWPLGNTPFEGGKIMYYRPSWYGRLKSGASYSSDFWETPAEKLMYGYDFSPLRPFDPYRFERKHYNDRPYPVTGEYFSGPFGPVTSVLNATVGKILKPQLQMHSEEVAQKLSGYVPAGQSGAYNPSGLMMSGRVSTSGAGFSAVSGSGIYGSGFEGQSGYPAQSTIASANAATASNAGPRQTARNMSFRTISTYNSQYVQSNQYGPPPVPGTVPPQIISAGTPISNANINFQAGEIGYRLQETFGIYGFAGASLREGLGFGQSDFEPQRAVLQSAAKAYGSSRAFWDLNLGGLGDVPLTAEGALGNIEFSEIIRRFVPKDRTNVNYLNPIQNTMGKQYPFLPGSDYFINFQQGDPFTKVAEGEIRLPGVGYERINKASSDYGPLTQLDILADVAPYSKEFRQLNRTIDSQIVTGEDRVKLEKIRDQVGKTTQKYDFAEYKYKGNSPEELGMDAKGYAIARIGEYIAHRDTYFNTKFLHRRTAQEDFERRNVYGATFPQWQNPIESFIMPAFYKSTQRNPITAAIGMGIAGSFFGATAGAKAFGAVAGFTAGASYSSYGNLKELITGDRFIPKERKKQLALEEYADILSYVKNTSLANQAREMGDMASANQFSQAAKRTMYGADIYGASVDTLSLAIPKRKREHFKAMIQETDEDERERILSTSGRLERRIYQAAWGQKVEERPDLVEYFSRHELPGLGWEGWHPNTNMEHVKIKMGQSMGIDMSQMGYYPQQVKEANLTNPSYPTFGSRSDEDYSAAQLRALMSRNGISGTVTPIANPFGSSSIDIFAGIAKELAF